MSWSVEDSRQEILETLRDIDPLDDEYATAISRLDSLNKAEAAMTAPELPVPEPTGVKAWMSRNSDAMIRVGGTLLAIVTIGAIETRGDVIFKSKASKYI